MTQVGGTPSIIGDEQSAAARPQRGTRTVSADRVLLSLSRSHGAGEVTAAGVKQMENPVHWRASDPDVMWASTNVAEAIAGVSTPLNWSLLGEPMEQAALAAFHALGAISRRELVLSNRAEDRFLLCFFGRTAINVDRMRALADGLPGTDGAAVEEQLFGSTRDKAPSPSQPWRVPIVIGKGLRVALTIRGATLHAQAETTQWWRAVSARSGQLEGTDPERLFREAQVQFTRTFTHHIVVSVLASGLYDKVGQLADSVRPGLGSSLFTGCSGMEETRMLSALWDVSRGKGDLTSFAATYGYYGANAGQISRPVWRSSRAHLQSLVDSYAAMDDQREPRALERRAEPVRAAAERELFAALSVAKRGPIRALLRIARATMGLREVGKASYLQCIDVARIAAHARGSQLAASGALTEPADVFFLTTEEAWGPGEIDLLELVKERRRTHQEYLGYRLPENWIGEPQPLLADTADAGSAGVTLRGIGVGTRAVTGTARVVTSPEEDTLLDGEILVCESSDPSWTALFLVAGAVVVELGSALSHAAIVARELDIPCVINAPGATRAIRTGDQVTVDPTSGEVCTVASEGIS